MLIEFIKEIKYKTIRIAILKDLNKSIKTNIRPKRIIAKQLRLKIPFGNYNCYNNQLEIITEGLMTKTSTTWLHVESSICHMPGQPMYNHYHKGQG